jgi:ATP-binding cassette, subfamily F, member 3
VLITKNLTFETVEGPLFTDVNISLDSASRKKIAVVGKNGCGKSTLLKLLKGDIEPTAGSVTRANEIIAYLPQDISFPDEEKLVGEFLESKLEEEWMTYQIDIALDTVSLPPEILLQQIKTLSGGQRVRIALAELLLQEPTILFLDEPTNHLDTASIEWVISFAKEFSGTVAFVSHDRKFINEVADKIWEITAERTIDTYGCNYDEFLIERYNRYQKKLADHELSQREVTELEEWLRANANHPKYKFTATVAQKKKALERMEKKAPPPVIPDPRAKMLNLNPTQKGTVLNLKIDYKKFTGPTGQEKEILKDIQLKIISGEKVLIKGPNGSGKTTLLNIIAGLDKDFTGQLTVRNSEGIGYLRQFSGLNQDRTVLEEFEARTPLDYNLVRSALSKYLFPAELIDTKIKNLSYGQQRRLEIAILLTNKPDLLLLDEPTNHLDVFLREDLERFLLEQDVAMCVISHDTYFTRKIGITRTLELS